MQRWIDSFHSGYNLTALLEYQNGSGDRSFDPAVRQGYEFYRKNFFGGGGAPKYLHDRLYPIDIHCCSQAILTFCAFSDLYPDALERATEVTQWTLRHMQALDGSFYYQKHRWWLDSTPYMRWGQAWMFRALTRAHSLVQGGALHRTETNSCTATS
jgi:hypothetical protein